MESSIFVSVPIKGMFRVKKEKRPGLIASTVHCQKIASKKSDLLYWTLPLPFYYLLLQFLLKKKVQNEGVGHQGSKEEEYTSFKKILKTLFNHYEQKMSIKWDLNLILHFTS